VKMTVDCRRPSHTISPLVWGLNHRVGESTPEWLWELRPAVRKWGGPASSRYNWAVGAANAGAPSFENFALGEPSEPAWEAFVAQNISHGVDSTLTLPLLGQVAKDTDAHTGHAAEFPPPAVSSIPAPVELIAQWVSAVHTYEEGRQQRALRQYVLGHQPLRWHTVHRDLHPQPVGYDELVERTVALAKAVRQSDPNAVLVSPAFVGFGQLQFSAQDEVAGYASKPDRRAHGDVPLVLHFLRKVREAEVAGDKPLLGALEVDWFPQGRGLSVGALGRTDPKTAAQRIRSTRSLWDPTYKDDSWIGEPVRLFPRLKEWMTSAYPGLGLSLGEYGFGAEQHMSGGLALAEALGRIAQANLLSAYHWHTPERGSPAYWAFRAFRNFDGQGSAFETEWVPTSSSEGTSLFASKDATGSHLVLVALNFERERALRVVVQAPGCGTVSSRQMYSYSGGTEGMVLVPPEPGAAPYEELLPPYSINVFDLRMAASSPSR
jgi:hypothetical protein